MPDGPDLRALKHFLGGGAWGYSRPVTCIGCPFSRPRLVAGGQVVTCDLLGGPGPVNHERPPCNADQWRQRARIELDVLECDNVGLAAVAHDAREESLMYARGLAEGTAAEREACCKDLCDDCAAGVPAVYDEAFGSWCHHAEVSHAFRSCRADVVRKRTSDA